MKDALVKTPARVRLRAALGVLLAVAALAATLPGDTAAEEASQPGFAPAGQLDAGRHHSCAVMPEGLRCWGHNGEGQLGYGNLATIGDNETPGVAGPVDLGVGRTAVSISAGHYHTCAELDDGGVRCWGFGGNGRLGHVATSNIGDGETPGSRTPIAIGAGRTATGVSAGGFHSCALLDGGDVRCWGHGFYGALGHGGGDPNAELPLGAQPPGGHPPDIGDTEAPSSVPPVNLGTGRTAKAISAGGYHTCAILDDDTVRCWGYGAQGQLGYGDRFNVADPSTLTAVPIGSGRTARAISAGDLHTCALLDDGNVRCWGAGLEGRLGTGSNTQIGDTEPAEAAPTVDLGPGRTAIAISAGDNHTCARLDDSSVRCWGAGLEGRLGYGNTTNIGDDETPGPFGPVSLGTGRSALAVAAGGRHSCARLDDGLDVLCWGYGGNGRLGYCNQRNVGDDELPSEIGPVPLDIAATAPSTAYTGCARAAAGGGAPPPTPAAPSAPARPASSLEAQASRRRAFRSCLAEAAGHARREIRRARRSSGRARARLRRHIKRHRARKRRACHRAHGRTPGRVTGLTARRRGRGSVVLGFRAAGTDGSRPPAARSYVVKQSLRPIRSRRSFRRAQTLCRGRCRFDATEVGTELTLRVNDLERRETYYYAVAARDNVSRRIGPRSRSVRVRTR